MSASCSSRVRLDVMINPRAAAVRGPVPISGIVTDESESASRRNASNSSSARSSSSTSSTAREPARTAAAAVAPAGTAGRRAGRRSRRRPGRPTAEPGVEELARVIPLVEGLPGVDALVALQADQLGAQHPGERPADLGLADARLTLEQQRPAHREGEVEGHGEAAVGQVRLGAKRGLEVVRAPECDRFTHAVTVVAWSAQRDLPGA